MSRGHWALAERSDWSDPLIMELKLTAEEADTLALVLESYVSDLRMEIADTERKRLRDDLKKRESVLLDLLGKLNSRTVLAGAWPYEPAPDVDSEQQ